MTHRNAAFIVILLGTAYIQAAAQKTPRRGPIIRQVDHILVESVDPGSLFAFFADTLQLPVAWPLADSGGFISGGLGAGNVLLEVFRYADREGEGTPKSIQARYVGIAFEPYPLKGALSELEIRGIPHNAPESRVSTLPDGSEGTFSTTVALPSFSKPGISIFLYEYSPEFLKPEVRRRQLGNRLALNEGGPLGLKTVRRIVLASTDYKKDKALWDRLLGTRTPTGEWRAGEGPAIALVQSSSDGIQRIVLSVESLDQAEAFLQQKQMLGSVSAEEVCLNASKVQGLRICLVD